MQTNNRNKRQIEGKPMDLSSELGNHFLLLLWSKYVAIWATMAEENY